MRDCPAEYASTLAPFSIAIAESGEAFTYSVRDGRIELSPGAERAKTQIELAQASFVGLTRDLESPAGLIYGARVRALRGDMMDFMQWEPALRWLYTGRPVYDPSAVDLRGLRGEPLDPAHAFRLGDDRDAMAHYLRTVGYVFVRDVLSRDEVETLRAESESLKRLAKEGRSGVVVGQAERRDECALPRAARGHAAEDALAPRRPPALAAGRAV